MNTSGEAAEQVMRMSLEGAEILIKLTGSGAKNAAVLLYSIYKEQNKTRGKERLTNIPLWAVTLIGSLLIWVLSFILILTVYGRMFKLFMYAAIAPIPLSSFAGEETGNIGKSFLKSFAGVCLEGAIIVLACVIYSLFASAPPSVSTGASAITQVWTYVGEIVFNMLVLVGTVKLSDQVVSKMLGI